MISITQDKIAGFKPRWASFSGFSLLLDNPNPGNSLTQTGNLLKINCSLDSSKGLDFYTKIDEALKKLDRNVLTNSYLFCPLLPRSYHVTLWDGINSDNKSLIKSDYNEEMIKFFGGLPESLGTPLEFIQLIRKSKLASKSLGKITFKFSRLAILGSEVLVARIEPDGDDSDRRLKRAVKYRAELRDEFEKELGIKTCGKLSPHVSLGYFANREHAELAQSRLPKWNDIFRRKIAKTTITFGSLDLYAFTDMVSFYKVM